MSGQTLGNLGGYASTAGAITSAIGTYFDVRAQRKAARYNAMLAQRAAMDALARGATDQDRSRQKYAQSKSSAMASFGARGVALDEGSPLDVLIGIDRASDEDAAIIRQNATREADGYRMQAYNSRAGAPSYTQVAGTLLTNAGSVAEKWYRSGQTKG